MSNRSSNPRTPRGDWPSELPPPTPAEERRLDHQMGLIEPSHAARSTHGGVKLQLGGFVAPLAPPAPSAAHQERHRLLNSRADFAPEFREALLTAPIAHVRHYVKTLPVRPVPRAGTLPDGMPRETAREAAYLDRAMGLEAPTSTRSAAHRLTLGGRK